MGIIKVSKKAFSAVLFLIVLALLPTGKAYSQNTTEYVVSGVVKVEGRDSTLAEATILVRDASRKEVARVVSGNDGTFSVKVASGEYSLMVLKKGFSLRRVKIEVAGKDLPVGEVALRPNDEKESQGSTSQAAKGDAAGIVIGGDSGKSLTVRNPENGKRHVKGRILEEGRKKETPLALCKIHVTRVTGERAARTITLEDGIFNFEVNDGTYKVLVENTGHKSKVLDLKVIGEDVDLGNIYLEIGEEIASAGIESKSLINRKGTRITYDVSKDPDASKINMTEMISRIPELRMAASNGKLKFENENISKILIDNAESGLINERRQYPMEFIKADHMKQVEVVLPGDIEYNNDKPILLISLSKALPYGFASNLEMTSTTKNRHNPSADLVINTPLIGIGLGYDYSYDKAPSLKDESVREMTDPASQTGRIESGQSHRDKSQTHNIKSNFFRTFANESIRFNASLNTSYSDAASFSESRTTIYDMAGTMKDKDLTTAVGSSKSPFRFNGALRLTGYFGAPTGIRGRKKNQWGIEYAYKDSWRESDETYETYSLFSSSGMKEHRAKASLELRNLLTSRLITSSFKMDGGYYNRFYKNKSSSPMNIEGLDYHQQVCFANVTALGEAFNKKLGYMLSLNSEYLSNSGDFLNGSTTSPLDYSTFNLNPTFGLNWRIKRSSLGLTYATKVQRPGINQLNPYEDRTNPYNIRTGNPDLKGERTDMYSLNYMLNPALKWMRGLSVSTSYSNTSDMISRIVTTDESGVATSTFCNIGGSESFGIRAMTNLTPCKKLSINIIASYQKTTTTLPSGRKNTFSSPSVLTSVNWHPEWFELNGTLQIMPSLASVQTSRLIMEPRGEIFLSRYFKRPHIGVSISASDVLHKGGLKRSVIQYDNFVQHNYIERLGRSYTFRVYWRFGKFSQTKSVDVKAYDMQ